MIAVRTVEADDIPKWRALSKEYDKYVLETVPSIKEWYLGRPGEKSMAFNDYMNAKINKKEAFMAIWATSLYLKFLRSVERTNEGR